MLDSWLPNVYSGEAVKYILTMMTCLLMAMGATASEVVALRPAIKEAAEAHGVDPVLVEAIIRHESAHATSKAARNKNNLAGIMGRSGQRRYETKEDCVRDLARILGNYKAKGRVTPTQISRSYCQSRAPWVRNVTLYMRQIQEGKWGAL